MEHLFIKFEHSQVGCTVLASRDGATWCNVELLRYGKTLDTQRTEREYLAMVERLKIPYTVVQ